MSEEKIISIPKSKKHIGKGLYGKYFRLSSKKGIKLIGRGFKTIKNMKKSKDWHMAIKEVLILIQVEGSGFTPKYSEIVIAKHNNKFFPAILMQHFGGQPLDRFNSKISFSQIYMDNSGKLYLSNKNQKKKLKKAKNYIRGLLKDKFYIDHRDLHDNNVIINSRKQIKIIDFSREQVRIKRYT